MCGISGIIKKKQPHSSNDEIREVTRRVAHRGRDGEGFLVECQVAFGHRRLAIIDLSDAGHQPMHYSDGSLTIVFNGEIFNYIELREELIVLGRVFRSKSDTEVILAAYAEWGERCVERFNGFWAFAIYDRRKKTIFCSRDRFGVKPFHYIDTDEVFAFGSEIKQLIDFCGKPVADQEGLHTFLLTGRTDYSDQTLFVGIRRLPGGHNLVFDLAAARITITRFYEVVPTDLIGATEQELYTRFVELLQDAVRLRLRSDVQVGTCLSGGLDSSVIATIASDLYREQCGKKFAAITAESIDKENDETEYARQIVQNADLEWRRVKPAASDILEHLDCLVYHQDEPFPTLSVMMQYLVMRTARANGIPVLLDGQGADEILLGYPWHFVPQLRSKWESEGGFAALQALIESGRNNRTSIRFRAATFAKILAPQLKHRWFQRMRGCGMHVESVPDVVREWSEASTDLRVFQLHEILRSVLPALLRFEDRNSMAFSIEGRLPFLDYRLVEFALGLPSNFKIRDGWSKWILRSSMSDRLPREIAWRKRKIGFEAPKSVWCDGVIAKTLQVVQRSELLAKVADIRQVERLSRHDPATAWRFHSVALWSERFNCTASC